MSTEPTFTIPQAVEREPDLGSQPPSEPRVTPYGPPLSADYVVVGSGLTGATIARFLADAGRDVVVLERRAHLGGDGFDHKHPRGGRIHTHCPHYFPTRSARKF